MNADRLLALYERIADAPDAVARLRRFILDLAVRGKLVPQDPADEPASDLLKRIAKEKARLVKAGQPRAKAVPPPDGNSIPFDSPGTWVWTPLNMLGRLSGGMTPSMRRPEYWGEDVVWLTPKDIKSDEVSRSEVKLSALGMTESRLELYPSGSLFIVARSGILKRTLPVSINIVPATANQDIKVLLPHLRGMERYLQVMLRGMEPFILRELVKTGTTVQSLKYSEFERQRFPLPPLAEQQRIVAKVDELMGLCDRLEEARTRREAHRERLTTATLSRLTTSGTDAETFQSHARFALDTLPALTTRPGQIKALRQTILDLAVRGLLAEQSSADEPAEKLLHRAQEEIKSFCSANRISPGIIKPVGSSDRPFLTPEGWQWVRLSELFKAITDGDHQPPPKAEAGIAFLTIGNISTGQISFSKCRFVPESYYRSLAPHRIPIKGDILYTVVGATYGRPVMVETDREFCVQRHIAIMKPVSNIAARYLLILLKSPLVYDQASCSTTGTAQPTIALRPLRNFLVPVPPLAEQNRIVAKVDALMKLCDQLEAALTSADTTRRRLLEALLHEALAPAADALEAAQ